MKESLQGWTVITGAGSGFGRALAVEAARTGARVLASDLDPISARETARLAQAAGAAAVESCQCDVTRIEEVRALARRLDGHPLALILHNAGVGCGGPATAIPLADWHWTIETNLLGAVHLTTVFLPLLQSQGHGQLIFIASAAGFLALPAAAPYNASKAGVIALAETLATELQGTPVRVRVVCPGFFRTGIINAGRFADPASRRAGERLASWGPSAEAMARRTFRQLRGSSVLLTPSSEIWIMSICKRLAPGLYRWLLAAIWRRWFGGV